MLISPIRFREDILSCVKCGASFEKPSIRVVSPFSKRHFRECGRKAITESDHLTTQVVRHVRKARGLTVRGDVFGQQVMGIRYQFPNRSVRGYWMVVVYEQRNEKSARYWRVNHTVGSEFYANRYEASIAGRIEAKLYELPYDGTIEAGMLVEQPPSAQASHDIH